MTRTTITGSGKIVRDRRGCKSILLNCLSLLVPFLLYVFCIVLCSTVHPPTPPMFMTSSFPYPQNYPPTLTFMRLFSRHSTPTSLYYSFSIPYIVDTKWLKVCSMYDQFDLQSYTLLSSLRSQPSPDIFTALSHHSSYLGKLDVFFFNFICPIILPSYNPTSYSGSYSSIIPEYILPNFPQIIVGLMTFLYLYRRIVWMEYDTEPDDFIPKPYQSVCVYGCNVVEASLKGEGGNKIRGKGELSVLL